MTDLMLSPQSRARHSFVAGTPLEIDGQAWLLADVIPVAGGDVWDRLYDQNCLTRRYEPGDLQLAAAKLLWANYHLTADEGVGLILAVPVRDLVEPVELALFGPDKPLRTYSEWVRSSLICAGIDPRMVPPGDLRAVLEQLVATGRCLPQHQFVSAAVASVKRRRMLDKIRG